MPADFALPSQPLRKGRLTTQAMNASNVDKFRWFRRRSALFYRRLGRPSRGPILRASDFDI